MRDVSGLITHTALHRLLLQELTQEHGIEQRPEWLHDNFGVTATLMALDPAKVRLNERIAAGKDRINGIKLQPVENTIAWGKKIIAYRADQTVRAIRKAIASER